MLCTYLASRFIHLYEQDKARGSIVSTSSVGQNDYYNKLETTDALIERIKEPTRFEKAMIVYKCNWKEALGVLVTTTV